MSGVRVDLNSAGCFPEAAGSVDRVNGWEAGLRDGLGFIHGPSIFTQRGGKYHFAYSTTTCISVTKYLTALHRDFIKQNPTPIHARRY